MPIQMTEEQLHEAALFPHDKAVYRVCNIVVRRFDPDDGLVLVRVDLDEVGGERQPVNTFPYIFDLMYVTTFNRIERRLHNNETVPMLLQRCNVFWMIDNKLDPDDPWRDHAAE